MGQALEKTRIFVKALGALISAQAQTPDLTHVWL